LRWVLGGSFIARAIWTLIPDEIEEDETIIVGHFGVFGATVMTFFLAEMGDKTQVATVAMTAHYSEPIIVIAGTTIGILIADIPAVFVGEKLADKIPMKIIHGVAASHFALLGAATMAGIGQSLFERYH
jgi:Ca2+/H+ antiporter, TMEM165/GDT1 family